MRTLSMSAMHAVKTELIRRLQHEFGVSAAVAERYLHGADWSYDAAADALMTDQDN
jgi:hypothetical protein